jgi:hypothetical protein
MSERTDLRNTPGQRHSDGGFAIFELRLLATRHDLISEPPVYEMRPAHRTSGERTRGQVGLSCAWRKLCASFLEEGERESGISENNSGRRLSMKHFGSPDFLQVFIEWP